MAAFLQDTKEQPGDELGRQECPFRVGDSPLDSDSIIHVRRAQTHFFCCGEQRWECGKAEKSHSQRPSGTMRGRLHKEVWLRGLPSREPAPPSSQGLLPAHQVA